MNIQNIISNFNENVSVHLAGRVKRIRTLSKNLNFVVLEENNVKIQLGFRNNNLPKPFDIISVFGVTGYSQTGEKTVWVSSFEIEATNKGELPSFKGLSDGKLKTEKRFLDVLTNQNLRNNLFFRSELIKKLRQFLWDKNYIEIETPVLSNVPSGAISEPFVTKFNALNQNYYLRIATEIALKKAIVAGAERVFEIGKIFRNEGIDKTHNPEFSSIELYQSYASLDDMKNLIIEFLGLFGINNFESFEYDEIVSKFGEDFDKQLKTPTFITGQPIEQTPLCSRRQDGKAHRFELFINGFEVANAYQELVDFKEQAERLEQDDGLIEALKYGCPKLAGMGIGIERLIMALQNEENIANVIWFPTKRN